MQARAGTRGKTDLKHVEENAVERAHACMQQVRRHTNQQPPNKLKSGAFAQENHDSRKEELAHELAHLPVVELWDIKTSR